MGSALQDQLRKEIVMQKTLLVPRFYEYSVYW
jgi:hypothetical protein